MISLKSQIRSAASRRVWQLARSVGVTPRKFLKRSSFDYSLLDQMRQDNAASHDPFRASPIWTDLANRFEDWFALDGLDRVEEHEMNSFFSQPFPTNPKLLRYATWLLYKEVERKDRLNLLDIPATASEASGIGFRFCNRLISWDQLISIDTLYAIEAVHPKILTERTILAELGAGWGRIGHILKRANPLATYVVFDLPEVLVVSQSHLPNRLPDAKVLNYQNSRTGSLNRARLQEYDLCFFGAHDLDRVEPKTFDAFINIASFQEMRRDQVEAYCNLINKTLSGCFYTQQLIDSRTHGYGVGEIAGRDEYPFPIEWKELTSRTAAWSDLYFEAVFAVNMDLAVGGSAVSDRLSVEPHR